VKSLGELGLGHSQPLPHDLNARHTTHPRQLFDRQRRRIESDRAAATTSSSVMASSRAQSVLSDGSLLRR